MSDQQSLWMGKWKRQTRADTDSDSDSDSDTDSEYKERVVTMLLCNHYERGHPGYFPISYGMFKYEDDNNY